MLFGLFGSAQSDSDNLGAGIGQGFHDAIDSNVEAERLGYYSTFLVEHHFTGWGQVSSTLNLLTWLAARTKTLRVGTATTAAVAQPRAARRAGCDNRTAVRLPAGFGRGQGLPTCRVQRFQHSHRRI